MRILHDGTISPYSIVNFTYMFLLRCYCWDTVIASDFRTTTELRKENEERRVDFLFKHLNRLSRGDPRNQANSGRQSDPRTLHTIQDLTSPPGDDPGGDQRTVSYQDGLSERSTLRLTKTPVISPRLRSHTYRSKSRWRYCKVMKYKILPLTISTCRFSYVLHKCVNAISKFNCFLVWPIWRTVVTQQSWNRAAPW